MKAALYARVSTTEHDQNPETQLRILRAFASEEGWITEPNEALEFVDHASGGDLNRPAWKVMMKQVRRGSIKAVAVTDIDRAFRSVLDGSSILAELDALNVRFVPLGQRGFDTNTPLGKAAIQMSLVWAELMRAELPAKIKAGQARARAEGRHPGRPRRRLSQGVARAAVLEHGGNITAAARALKVPRSTLQSRLK
jgi:DNA invertase Pin-like site-specific DNA recombinase